MFNSPVYRPREIDPYLLEGQGDLNRLNSQRFRENRFTPYIRPRVKQEVYLQRPTADDINNEQDDYWGRELGRDDGLHANLKSGVFNFPQRYFDSRPAWLEGITPTQNRVLSQETDLVKRLMKLSKMKSSNRHLDLSLPWVNRSGKLEDTLKKSNNLLRAIEENKNSRKPGEGSGSALLVVDPTKESRHLINFENEGEYTTEDSFIDLRDKVGQFEKIQESTSIFEGDDIDSSEYLTVNEIGNLIVDVFQIESGITEESNDFDDDYNKLYGFLYYLISKHHLGNKIKIKKAAFEADKGEVISILVKSEINNKWIYIHQNMLDFVKNIKNSYKYQEIDIPNLPISETPEFLHLRYADWLDGLKENEKREYEIDQLPFLKFLSVLYNTSKKFDYDKFRFTSTTTPSASYIESMSFVMEPEKWIISQINTNLNYLDKNSLEIDYDLLEQDAEFEDTDFKGLIFRTLLFIEKADTFTFELLEIIKTFFVLDNNQILGVIIEKITREENIVQNSRFTKEYILSMFKNIDDSAEDIMDYFCTVYLKKGQCALLMGDTNSRINNFFLRKASNILGGIVANFTNNYGNVQQHKGLKILVRFAFLHLVLLQLIVMTDFKTLDKNSFPIKENVDTRSVELLLPSFLTQITEKVKEGFNTGGIHKSSFDFEAISHDFLREIFGEYAPINDDKYKTFREQIYSSRGGIRGENSVEKENTEEGETSNALLFGGDDDFSNDNILSTENIKHEPDLTETEFDFKQSPTTSDVEQYVSEFFDTVTSTPKNAKSQPLLDDRSKNFRTTGYDYDMDNQQLLGNQSFDHATSTLPRAAGDFFSPSRTRAGVVYKGRPNESSVGNEDYRERTGRSQEGNGYQINYEDTDEVGSDDSDDDYYQQEEEMIFNGSNKYKPRDQFYSY